MELMFWGAARTVTGSSHLLTISGKRLLLDCGLFQGNRRLARELNVQFPVAPETVDEMILSHAHIDHCGNIPQLVKRGFKGPIHCTSATGDLARIMMRDSGHIQEMDVKFLNRKQKRNGEPLTQPLYTLADAEAALPRLKPVNYHQPLKVLKGLAVNEFYDAGHILGSAFVSLTINDDGTEKKLVFSGDIGRKNVPILRDPETPPEADYLILESTYGNRRHDEYAMAEAALGEAVGKVFARRGKIVIPAFSVGRTQEIVYALNKLWNKGKLPRVPVYVDSPLSANATEIFRNHPECYDDEIKQSFLHDPDPFGFEGLLYVRDVEMSKRINQLNGPCVIISASGMAEAGRVLHHLANNITDPRNAVLIVGFQAENTLGRKIVERHAEVRIFGDLYPLKAEVITFSAFSAHGDSEELREFAHATAATGRLKKIFLVHGEEQAALALQSTLAADLPKVQVEVPSRGDRLML